MERYEFHDPSTLMGAANKLQPAEEKQLYTRSDDEDGGFSLVQEDGGSEWGWSSAEQVETHKLVYNPDNGQQYGVVTDEYVVIEPPEFFGPLVQQIKAHERNDVRGTIIERDGGAKGYAEMLFDTDKIWPPGRERSQEPVRCGITVRWSHDSGVSVRASGFSQDGACKNTMRKVTDSVHVKHAGDVEGRVDWHDKWDTVLSQLGAFSENLAGIIETAQETELWELDEEPWSSEWIGITNEPDTEDITVPPHLTERNVVGLMGFYQLLGFPQYLSNIAGNRLAYRLMQQESSSVDAWNAYSAMTYALTHEARFETASPSDDDYHRKASDILMNPLLAKENAETALAQELSVEPEQETFGDEETLGDAIQQYREREQQLRESLSSD